MQSKKFYENLGKYQLTRKRENLDLRDAFLIKTYKGKKLKVLDLGCGKGYLSYGFAEIGNKVTVVDASESMLNYAKRKNNHKNIVYVHSDFQKIELENKFDLVFAINSFVHIKKLDPLLKSVHKSMRKNGKFIICFPHPFQDIETIKDNYGERIIKLKTKFGIVMQYHRPIQFYINKLIESGFRVSKVYEFPLKKPSFFIIETRKP